MANELMLKDIVERAGLDRRATRYVLDSAKGLKIPDATGQGQHRTFTTDQAVRLALCSQLVSAGFKLSLAESLTDWCEESWREVASGAYLFQGKLGNPWELSVIMTGPLVRLGLARPGVAAHEFFDLSRRRRVKCPDIPAHVPKIEWSLTHLAQELARKK